MLEELYSRSGELPDASVWISPPETSSLNLEGAASTIKNEAERLWRGVKICSDVDHGDTTASVDFSLPQPREELVGFLVKNEARAFIECMVGHFETLAKLTRVLDEVFQAEIKKGQK